MTEVPAGQGPRVVWDRSAVGVHFSTIATATPIAGEVLLHFGVRDGIDRPGQQQGVKLLRRLAMRPMTAKHLHDMLSRLIAEAAAAGKVSE
jgi:hypothetical protein